MLLPLEEHGIERSHLDKIWKYPEIVSEIDKISEMEGQYLQENKLSVTLTVLELIDQMEDEEIRNSADRLLQLIIDRNVEYYKKRRDYLIENDGESLKLELVAFKDMLLELGDDFEFTEEDIDSILSVDKPYDILHREYRNIKSPELKLFLGYEFKLFDNIRLCTYFLEVLKIRQYFLIDEKKPYLDPNSLKNALNEHFPFTNRIEETKLKEKREKQKIDFKDYITKLNKFTINELNSEFVFIRRQINEFSELLTELKKLREYIYTAYDRLEERLINTEKDNLFDILNKKF